ncbi:MAG: CBS domain-containing protein [Chloroflexota bacterium]
MRYTIVDDILEWQDCAIYAVGPDEPVYSALQLMAEKNIGAVLVMEGERLLGILSERDYTRRVILQDRDAQRTLVGEIMTSQVVTVEPQCTLQECMKIMTYGGFRHLPVMIGDEVVGLISIREVARALIP